MKKILVSACLLGIDCKYNGSNNLNEKVLEYLKDKEIIPICPEMLGGLSTPRNPSEIVNGRVVNNIGIDVTEEYNKGANEVLKLAKLLNVGEALLKEKSPSCGVHKIYDGTFSNNKIDGVGVTTKLLIENGIKVYSEEDI